MKTFDIESALYTEAESILKALNLPMDTAITLFLRQVVLHNGLPFPIALPDTSSGINKEESCEHESFDWMGDLFENLLKETESIKAECAEENPEE